MSSPQPTDTDVTMMRRALQLAKQAWTAGEVPIAAILYRGDELIAAAHNTRETDADPTAHAELVAIRDAARQIGDWRLNEYSLAVTLEPCPMCAGAIVNARVGRVIYGATDPKAGAVDTLYTICSDERLNHQPTIVASVLADECGQMLKGFFEERRHANREARKS